MSNTFPNVNWGPIGTILHDILNTVLSIIHPVTDFLGRLISNPYRLGWVALAVLVTLGMLKSNIDKWLIPISAFGSAWMTWIIYNAFTSGPDTPLITGPTDLSMISSGWKFFVLLFGTGLGIVVFWTSKKNHDKEKVNILVRIWCAFAAPLGVWLIVTLLVDAYLIIRPHLPV